MGSQHFHPRPTDKWRAKTNKMTKPYGSVLYCLKKNNNNNNKKDLPSGPVVKNLPSSAGDMGLIPGQGNDPTCSRATKSEYHNY